MPKKKNVGLDFVVDKLTNSIINIVTGDSFPTEVSVVTRDTCKLSFQRGHDGNLAFVSKSQLIHHYEETLGAIHIGGRLMIIEMAAALKLIDKYF